MNNQNSRTAQPASAARPTPANANTPSAPSSKGEAGAPASKAGAPASKADAPSAKAETPQRQGSDSSDHEQVALIAYEIWISEGRPWGSDREHWFEAERRWSEQSAGSAGVVSNPDR